MKVLALLVAAGCAIARPPPPSAPPSPQPARPEPRPGWPDTWGITFALRCAGHGEDLLFCTCLANEIQRRWTPEELEARGPEGLDEEARPCRERAGSGEAR